MPAQPDGTGPLTTHISTVRELLGGGDGPQGPPIRIPDYQRPYKWSVANVEQLVDDIDRFRASGRYRIGTVILHATTDDDRQPVLDIVDGQQRFLTFALLAHALRPHDDRLTQALAGQQVSANGLETTAANLRTNYAAITRLVARAPWDPETFAEFFLDRCEVVVLRLTKDDEAFQMFDSQNTRGRALYPTDLLKAFHIREMGSEHVPARQRLEMVRLWEAIPPELVNELFSDHLFKIKRWANARSVPDRGFSAADVAMFKGIRESDPSNAHNRWAMPFLYAKNYTADFAQDNATLIRYGAMKAVSYPFQIDQPVVNGETFFAMVAHYYELGRRCGLYRRDTTTAAPTTDNLRPLPMEDLEVESLAAVDRMVEKLDAHRRDPRFAYVRNLIDCLLLYYVDRFGEQELDRAVDLIVRHALALRVAQKQVKRITVDKYARGLPPEGSALPSVNLFAELREALRAVDFLRRPAPDLIPPFQQYKELEQFFDTSGKEDR